MANNSQSRKWALVINNPLDAGLDHTAIAAILALFSPAYYLSLIHISEPTRPY